MNFRSFVRNSPAADILPWGGKQHSFEEITIPAAVVEIGDYAFYECKSLHSVYCKAMTPPRITAIFNTPGVTVYVPASAVDAYKKDFNWRDYDIQPMPSGHGE